MPGLPQTLSFSENDELIDLFQIISKVEYLVLLLVLLYCFIPGVTIVNREVVLFGTLICMLVIMALHLVLHQRISKTVMAVETFIIAAFISFIMWHTGKGSSPFMELYLVVIIISSMTLNWLLTLALITFISLSLFYFDFSEYHIELFKGAHLQAFVQSLVTIYALTLIAYLTIMVALLMQKTRHRIKLLSEKDAMTGLFNMRAFSTLIKKGHRQSLRYKHYYAVLMVDADDLKSINDHYGHEMGNKFIINIANAISATVRDADIVARYGGDEFIVFLPETSREGALGCADRIRQYVQRKPLQVAPETEITLSVSIGVACFPLDGVTPEDLINVADRALYQSKHDGKNSVTGSENFQDS